MPERPVEVPDFSERLRAARELAGYPTQRSAAREIGMEANHLCRLERASRVAAWPTVYRLIVGLRLPLELFFPEDLILDAARRIEDRATQPPRRSHGDQDAG
jgi:transcriptional regulator with XRE-family HTH domain